MITRLELPISIDYSALAAVCEQYHVQRLAVFGSVLRDDFQPDSDIDLLVEFDPAHQPGLIGLGMLEAALAEVLHRSVDLLTFRSLHPLIRTQVLENAKIIYDAA